MNIDYLKKIDACKNLLPEPGNIVVAELIKEIYVLRALVEAVDGGGFDTEFHNVDGKNWFDVRDKALS